MAIALKAPAPSELAGRRLVRIGTLPGKLSLIGSAHLNAGSRELVGKREEIDSQSTELIVTSNSKVCA